VDAFKDELQALRRESVKLRKLVERSRNAPAPELAAPVEEREAPPPTGAVAPARESPEQYFARVGETFELEPHDALWNPAAELASRFTKLMPKGSSLDAVTCRKTMCRVQTSHPSLDSYRKFTRSFVFFKGEPPWRGPALFVDVESQTGSAASWSFPRAVNEKPDKLAQ